MKIELSPGGRYLVYKFNSGRTDYINEYGTIHKSFAEMLREIYSGNVLNSVPSYNTILTKIGE